MRLFAALRLDLTFYAEILIREGGTAGEFCHRSCGADRSHTGNFFHRRPGIYKDVSGDTGEKTQQSG